MFGRTEGWNLCPIFGWCVGVHPWLRTTHSKCEAGLAATETVWYQSETQEMWLFQARSLLCRSCGLCREIQMNLKEVEAVQAPKNETPATVREVRKLMGFLSYYRPYIPDFSRIQSAQLPPSHPVNWTEIHQEVLGKIVKQLTNPPIMAYPDLEKPFVLHVDASEEGLGAVLYQRQNGSLRVITYGSRTLTATERNDKLHSGKLEFLALKWAVTEHFHDYLFHAPHFVVYSDNNPLTYITKSAKLNATGHRWVAELADYRFTLTYRPGTANRDADFLSRRTKHIEEIMQECIEECCPEVMESISKALEITQRGEINWISAVTWKFRCSSPSKYFICANPTSCSGWCQISPEFRPHYKQSFGLEKNTQSINDFSNFSEAGRIWSCQAASQRMAPHSSRWWWDPEEKNSVAESACCPRVTKATDLQTAAWGDGTLGSWSHGCSGQNKCSLALSPKWERK